MRYDRLAVRAAVLVSEARRSTLKEKAADRRLTEDQWADLYVMQDLDVDRLTGTTVGHRLNGLEVS